MTETIIKLWDSGEYTAIDIAEHFDIRLSDVIDILYTKYPYLKGVE